MSNTQVLLLTLINRFPLCQSQQEHWNHHGVSIESVYARYKKMTEENRDLNTTEERKDHMIKLTQLPFTDAAILLQRHIYPPTTTKKSNRIENAHQFLEKEIAFAKRTSLAMMVSAMRKAHPYDSFVTTTTVPMTRQVFDHLFGHLPQALLTRKIIRSDIGRQKMISNYTSFNNCFGNHYPVRRWKDGTTCTVKAPIYIYFHNGVRGDLGMRARFMLFIKDENNHTIHLRASSRPGESVSMRNTNAVAQINRH